jgi:hypothetical protein
MDVYSAPLIAELQPRIHAYNRRAARWRAIGRFLLGAVAVLALASTGIVLP